MTNETGLEFEGKETYAQIKRERDLLARYIWLNKDAVTALKLAKRIVQEAGE